MISVSDAFNQAFKQPTRQVLTRITMNDITYTNNDVFSVSYEGGSIVGEGFNIGSTFSNSIKITFAKIIEGIKQLDKIKLEFGIVLADGTSEYVSMGYFFVSTYDPDRNENRTTIEAYDAMSQMEGAYESGLTYPATLLAVATEIANKSGMTIDTLSFQRLPNKSITKISGKTYRQVIGMIAQFAGGFVIFDRSGKLSIRTLNDPNFSVSTADYFSKGLSKDETMYKLDGINCKVKTSDSEESTLQSGSTTGNQISLENDVMTQIYLDDIYQQLKNLNYYPFTLSWRGNPALEAGDWISTADTKENSFKMPNLSYKLEFSGGLKATSSAETKSIASSSVQFQGTLQQKVAVLEGWKNASGGWTYTGLEEPINPQENDVWFKPNGPDTETWVYENGKWVFKTSTAGITEAKQAAAEAKVLGEEAKQAGEEAKALGNEALEAGQNAETIAKSADANAANALTNTNDAVNQATQASQKADNSAELANEAKAQAATAENNANTALANAQQAVSGVTDLNKVVTTNSADIDKLEDAIVLKADTTTVDAVIGRVSTTEGKITTMAGQIELKANQTDVDAVTGRVSATEASLKLQDGKITTLTTKTDGLDTSLSSLNQDYNGFKGTVYTKGETDTKITTVQATIDTFKTTVASTYSSKIETDSKVANVQANVDKLGTNIAYAWSEDGKDRFTKGYPNENLILGSDASSKSGFFKNFDLVKDGYGEVTMTSANTYSSIDLREGYSVGIRDYPVGAKVRISFEIMYTKWDFPSGTNRTEFWLGQKYTSGPTGSTGEWRDVTSLALPAVGDNGRVLNTWYPVTAIFTIPEQASEGVGDASVLQFYNSSTTSASFTARIRKPKMEYSWDKTIYTTNPKDDYDNAVPRYVGRSLKDSQNPDDFKWEVNPDRRPWTGYMQELDGTDFSKVAYGENLLTNSGSPFVMGYGITNTTWKDGWAYTTLPADSIYTARDEILPQTGSFELFSFIPTIGVTYTQSILVKTDATYKPDNSTDFKFTWFIDSIGHNLVNSYCESLGNNVYRLYSTMTPNVAKAIRLMDLNSLDKILDYKTSGTYIAFSKPKLEIANSAGIATPWTPNPNDKDSNGSTYAAQLAAIPKYIGYSALPSDNWTDYEWHLSSEWNEVKSSTSIEQTNNVILLKADKTTLNEVTGRVTANEGKITLLSDRMNFRITNSDGSITQIDLANKVISLSGEQVNITGNTYIANGVIKNAAIADLAVSNAKIANLAVSEAKIANLAVSTAKIADLAVTNAKIGSISADKINVGTLNGANVNVINLNASNITSGTISGTNLSINLATGVVNFQKGRINSASNNIDINIDAGYFSVADSSTRVIIKGGELQFVSPTIFDLDTNPYLSIDNSGGSQGLYGASIVGRDFISLANRANNTNMFDIPIGLEAFAGISFGKPSGSWRPTKIGGAERGIILSGGAALSDSLDLFKGSPRIVIGSDVDGQAGGNRIYILGEYIHMRSVYTKTTSTAANVVVATDGALVRSTSASKYKSDIQRFYDTSIGEKLLDLPYATWLDKAEMQRYSENPTLPIPRKNFGMIAEDLADAGLEELVVRGENNQLEGIQYERLAVALIPVIRELKQEIETLKARVA